MIYFLVRTKQVQLAKSVRASDQVGSGALGGGDDSQAGARDGAEVMCCAEDWPRAASEDSHGQVQADGEGEQTEAGLSEARV